MEDSKIVQLYWDRSPKAIPATAEKYEGYCACIARNILGNQEDTEECVNDTWLSAWNAMPPHRPAALAPFLGKLARNHSLKRYQHNSAAKRGGGQTALVLDELTEVVSDTGGVEQELHRRELIRTIDAFLGGLPPEKRGIFLRRYWYFDSIPQIASRFGKTENHISVILNRLRAKLRGYLTERGFEL